tara:strand:- start:884 stop:1891 length:1008 start_codon:yes stop_codon:yes gene_type:complete
MKDKKKLFKSLGLTAGIIGVLLLGIPNKKEDDTRKRVVFETHLEKNSLYGVEAFDLAEQFLEEKTGFDFDFVPYSEDANTRVNHVDRFSIVQMNLVGKTKDLRDGLVDLYASRDKLTSQIERLKNSGDRVNLRKLEDLLVFLDKSISDNDQTLREARIYNAGEVNLEDSTVYLMESAPSIYASNAYTANVNQLLKQREILDNLKKSSGANEHKEKIKEIEGVFKTAVKENESFRKKMVKGKAMIIAHEVGHIFGLHHTHQFSNDRLEDMMKNGLPNVMSYQEVGPGKYGFDITEKQVGEIREYVKKGKPYQDLKGVGFNLVKYLTSKAKKNGWKK